MDAIPWLLVGGIWLLNLFISWFNARQVGLVWAETKQMGGLERVVVWSGAVMSASGFSWCYLIALLLGAFTTQPYWIPLAREILEEPQLTQLLTAEAVTAGLSLGYLVLIPGILLSGLVIWVHSLVAAWRRRDLPSMGVAAWNTYAQVHNTMGAMRGMPEAADAVKSFFAPRGGSRNGAAAVVVLALVVLALLAGVLTTWAIINHYAGRAQLPERREEAAA